MSDSFMESMSLYPEQEEEEIPCTRCKRLGPANCGQPASTIELLDEAGNYFICCGYGSAYDMEVFKFDIIDEWIPKLTQSELKEASLCDICIKRYDILRMISLDSSPWRRAPCLSDITRRQSAGDISNYKSNWKAVCGWRRKSI